MSIVSRILSIVVLSATLSVQAAAHTIITRMSDGQTISMAQLAAAAGNSDVILIGEAHDNKYHHGLQLDLIRSLYERQPELAIGLEMIEAQYQEDLDEWVSGGMPEGDMKGVFARNWSDWELYREIFLFARDNRIPMVALNVSARIVRKVSQQGFASLTKAERQGLPEGTSCDYRNPQIVMLRKSFHANAHHMAQEKGFDNFCEAQTVRNSGMALRIAAYLKNHPGRKMVTLTGIWHAEKHAIPDQLERNGGKLSYTVILPESPALTSKTSTADEADYLVEL